MRVALMVEGQEGVSWDEWLALADACERHGLEAMYRSDHYLSTTDAARARAMPGRCSARSRRERRSSGWEHWSPR